jgi:hypothetical protein
MNQFYKVATNFASALVDGQFDIAHSLLIPELQQILSISNLSEQFVSMYKGYSQGSPTHIHFDDEFSMREWPGKRNGDIGWAYVSIVGDDFVEAVRVIITEIDGELFIRDLEWGRP